MVFAYPFDNSPHVITWKKTQNGVFTTRTVYDLLTKTDTGQSFRHIWKAKIPPRVKIFMPLLENDVVLTKDNMSKRKWIGNILLLLFFPIMKLVDIYFLE